MSELDLLAQCRKAFDARMQAEGIRQGTKTWQKQLETFMQGVLATATFAGIMTHDRADMFAFMCMCGRLPEMVGYGRTANRDR